MSNQPNNMLVKRPATLQSLIKNPAYSNRFEEVLGKRSPQFISSLLSLGSTMQDVEPKSIIAGAMIAAALDLPIDKNLGFAWLVPYRSGDTKTAQFQMGYKGYVQLGLRTGQYKFLNVTPICQGELVKFDKLRGAIELDDSKRTSDEIVGYASYLELVTGFQHATYWTVDRLREHAQQYSQAYRSGRRDTPWISNFGPMAMKTVLKDHIGHWGPMSIELQRATVHDQGIQIDVDSKVSYDDNPGVEETQRVSTTERASISVESTPADPNPEASNQPKESDEQSEADAGLAPVQETAPAPAPAPVAPPEPSGPSNIEKLHAFLLEINVDSDTLVRWMASADSGKYFSTPIGGIEEMEEMSPKKFNYLVNNFPKYLESIVKFKTDGK
jgi:recombination protein RecT